MRGIHHHGGNTNHPLMSQKTFISKATDCVSLRREITEGDMHVRISMQEKVGLGCLGGGGRALGCGEYFDSFEI